MQLSAQCGDTSNDKLLAGSNARCAGFEFFLIRNVFHIFVPSTGEGSAFFVFAPYFLCPHFLLFLLLTLILRFLRFLRLHTSTLGDRAPP